MENMSNSIVNIGDINYLGRIFDKAEKGEPIGIVYLGGSITQGCNASTEDKRYVNMSAKWWEEKFPQSKISFFNAGIGATTSQFACARVEEHVLDKNPDLVFVEFSVNDEDDLFFMETYESLIRRLLKNDSVKAVVMINNLFYDTGTNAQGVHNAVGLHYKLPIVSVRDYIFPEIYKGEINLSDYTDDMLHPKDLGHKMISDLIINLLETEYTYYKKIGICGKKPELSTKLTACRFENAMRYQNTNCVPVLEGFTADMHISDYFSDPFKDGWTASSKGDSITFTAKGNILMLQWKRTVNHPAPVAYAVIDGKEDKKIKLDANFEETWGDLCCLTTLTENAGEGTHTIKITVDQEGRQNNPLMLISLITAD